MQECDFVRMDDHNNYQCSRCGQVVKNVKVLPIRANCGPQDQASRGLGDTIAKITSAVGIQPCGGCQQRQEALNRMFPYRQDD